MSMILIKKIFFSLSPIKPKLFFDNVYKNTTLSLLNLLLSLIPSIIIFLIFTEFFLASSIKSFSENFLSLVSLIKLLFNSNLLTLNSFN